MNSMLPAPRDLPPNRHIEIRAEVQRAIGRRRARFAPIITAVAALAVIGLVAFFVPWQPTASPPAVDVPTTLTTTLPVNKEPVIPGLTREQQDAIAEGCRESAGVPGKPKLYNYVTDNDTKHALVYTHDSALSCTIDGPQFPYNSGLAGGIDMDWLAGAYMIDSMSGSAGGDASYKNPKYKGKRGFRNAMGRISPEVARVTFTVDGQTVDAVLANGTFVARVLHPSTWVIPDEYEQPVVKAFDAKGNQLTGGWNPQGKCYKTPAGKVIGYHQDPPDPATCLPAKAWP